MKVKNNFPFSDIKNKKMLHVKLRFFFKLGYSLYIKMDYFHLGNRKGY